jgi:hypothetical protein
VFTLALTFYPLPRERKLLSIISGFADERPANPVVSIFKEAAKDSPSPGGEGRGGRMSFGKTSMASLDIYCQRIILKA